MVTAEELRLKFTYHPETGVFHENHGARRLELVH